MLAVAIAAISVNVGFAKGTPKPNCELRICEHNDGRGYCKKYGPGSYSAIDSRLRGKASSLMYCHDCTFEFWDDYNFKGERMWATSSGPSCGVFMNLNNIALNGKPHPFFPTSRFADNLYSFKVNNARRRMEGEELPEGTYITSDRFESLKLHQPLCEAVLEDGIASNWGFGDSQEEKEKEIESLLDTCEIQFGDDEEQQATCKFYVYAAAAFFDTEELVAELEFDPAMETDETEYMRCGIVVNKIHEAIRDGKLSGIEFSDGDANSDYVTLSPQDLDFVQDDGVIQAVVSVGSVIALAVSNTLVKVCKSFAADGHYLEL